MARPEARSGLRSGISLQNVSKSGPAWLILKANKCGRRALKIVGWFEDGAAQVQSGRF